MICIQCGFWSHIHISHRLKKIGSYKQKISSPGSLIFYNTWRSFILSLNKEYEHDVKETIKIFNHIKLHYLRGATPIFMSSFSASSGC